MAADRTDEPGVLGNLPRSRPGQRSDKRAGAAATKSTARRTATARAKPAARKPAARKPAARKPAARPRPAAEPPRPAAAEPRSTDPITGAVRLAGKVAEAGLKTAGGLLRRLPGR